MLGVMLTLASVVVVAHDALHVDHPGDGAVMCVAMLTMAGAGVAATGLASARRIPLGCWPRTARAAFTTLVVAHVPVARARPGPTSLQVFLL